MPGVPDSNVLGYIFAYMYMLIGYKGHSNTIRIGLFRDHYDNVIALEDGQSSQGKSEPITLVMNACDWYDIVDFDFIECFTTTFLRAHSWLNWVDMISSKG